MALAPGQCIRISTGARVPDGADAVVQVENTKVLQNDASFVEEGRDNNIDKTML
jgi:molybdopterin biosynthesis enzyme